jgi:hypothetical protein
VILDFRNIEPLLFNLPAKSVGDFFRLGKRLEVFRARFLTVEKFAVELANELFWVAPTASAVANHVADENWHLFFEVLT